MKKIFVGENDIGRRLDNFILSCVTKFTKILVCKLIRKKKIKVNGKKSEPGYRLKNLDTVEIHVKDNLVDCRTKSDDFLHAVSDLNIVYEDDNILIIDKPVGLLCHPDKNNKIDCVINRIKKYLFEKGEYKFFSENTFSPSLANRIDRNTQGLVISAKNLQSLKILNDKIKNREIKKYYKCLVRGIPPKSQDYLVSFLAKDSDNNKVHIYKTKKEGSKIIKTKYKLMNYNKEKNVSLLEIELITGRSHQIRAHLAFIGHPILGDKKYSNISCGKNKHQKLISYKLKFDFIHNAGILNYLNQKEIEIKNLNFDI